MRRGIPHAQPGRRQPDPGAARRRVDPHDAKTSIIAGLLLAAGMAAMSRMRPDGGLVLHVLPASLIASVAMSVAFIASLGTAISSAKPEEGGLASGIVNSRYQVGSAPGLAIVTVAATSQGAGRLGDLPALTDGYSAAFLGAAAIAAAAWLVATLLLRAAHSRAQEAPDASPAIAAPTHESQALSGCGCQLAVRSA